MPTTPQMFLPSHYGATLLLLHKSSLSIRLAVLDWPLTPSRKRPRRAPVFPGASSGVLLLCSIKLRYRDTIVTRCKCAELMCLHPGVNVCSCCWELTQVKHKYSRNSGGREPAWLSEADDAFRNILGRNEANDLGGYCNQYVAWHILTHVDWRFIQHLSNRPDSISVIKSYKDTLYVWRRPGVLWFGWLKRYFENLNVKHSVPEVVLEL